MVLDPFPGLPLLTSASEQGSELRELETFSSFVLPSDGPLLFRLFIEALHTYRNIYHKSQAYSLINCHRVEHICFSFSFKRMVVAETRWLDCVPHFSGRTF